MAEGEINSGSTRSWWARATLIGSMIALVLLFLGPVGTRIGIWGFQTGLLVMIPAGTLLAAIGLLVALISLFVSKKRGFAGDPPALFTSIAICAVILVTMGLQFQKGTSVPAIHNISTDLSDPPRFTAVIIEARGEGSNPLKYDAEKIGPQQQAAYPEVTTLIVSQSGAATLSSAVAVLEDMGLEVVNVDEEAGIVEATETTFWFGFKDDLVVRVRETAGGSEVDVRSVSRVGLSDLGANAARIQQVLGALKSAS